MKEYRDLAQSGNFPVMVLVPFWHCLKASVSLVLSGWNEPTPLRRERHFGPRCATGNSCCQRLLADRRPMIDDRVGDRRVVTLGCLAMGGLVSHCGEPIRRESQKRRSVPPSFCVFRPCWVWIARRRSADCSILIVREPPALLRKSLRGRAPQARGYGASAGEGSDVMDAVWRSRRFGLRGQVHLVTETLQRLTR